MDRLGIAQIMASMLSGMGFGAGNGAGIKSAGKLSRHLTKKGPGRSKGMKVSAPGSSGSKLAKKAFLGTCTLRNGVGAAGRLALEGKLGKK